jgi:hypothetical protein
LSTIFPPACPKPIIASFINDSLDVKTVGLRV